MGRKNTLENHIEGINGFFGSLDIRSFTLNQFKEWYYSTWADEYNLPTKKPAYKVLDFLIKKGWIYENHITHGDDLYSWKTQDLFSVLNGIKKNSYFAYYTAMHIHGLTLQIPKVIYLNYEHSKPLNPPPSPQLKQSAIDLAFSKPQRKSSNEFFYKNYRIVLTNSMYTGRLGVIKVNEDNKCYYHTDLEKTLIDISIRPVYAGGVFEIKEAYVNARGSLDVEKMRNYLDKLNYIYPYHQLIGFLLESTGYSEMEVKLFEKNKFQYKFYLTYNMRNKEFSKKWKMYYPKGFNIND